MKEKRRLSNGKEINGQKRARSTWQRFVRGDEQAGFREKIIDKCEELDFRANGLSEKTQFLFSYTHETYNIYTRPIEYPRIEEKLKKIEGHVWTLANLTRELNPQKYRFVALHYFTRLNEKVWLTSDNRKINLI